jgi:hypothetical protein
LQFRYRGSRHESAVAQLFSLGHISHHTIMKPRTITWSEFEVGGDIYHITVRDYDTQLNHVTADWIRASDRQTGELGYGISSCDEAIRLAEIAILNRRKVESHVA